MSTRSGHKRVRSCERYFSMLRKFTGLVAVGLIAASGCNSGTPGGPGAADSSAKKPLYGEAKDTFNLSVPALSTSLKQGDSKEATISIKRGKNFDQDVTLTFAELPKGVTVEPASPVIKHGDAEVKFTFKAVDAATLGDFTVKLTGHPTKGSDALHDFKLTLVHKDTFTLSAPVLSTTLKQGGTKEVSIGIKRDKDFDQDVALTVADLPKGVTCDPASSVIKHGDTEMKLTFKATDEAALGDFGINMTGHPNKGADASREFKLTVAKK